MATRSPNYPAMDLEEAIESVRKIYLKEHTSPMDREAAVKAMGYTSLNGASARNLAAVSSYGLLVGRGDNIKVSDDAICIIADEGSENQSERGEALLRSLRHSKLLDELYGRFGANASESNISSFLMKQGFKPEAAEKAANTYRDSVAFVESVRKGYNEREKKDELEVKAGALVQWESGGVLQFPEPRRVRDIQELNGQVWVFVEGSETGILVDEVIVEEAASREEGGKVKPPRLPLEGRGSANPPGEKEWLRGPLSKETSYRIFVHGELGPKEIGKLIKLLTAQKAVLTDDDEEESQEEGT